MYLLYTILPALLSFLVMRWLKRRRYCTDVKRLDGKTALITGKVINCTATLKTEGRISNGCLLPIFARYIGEGGVCDVTTSALRASALHFEERVVLNAAIPVNPFKWFSLKVFF